MSSHEFWRSIIIMIVLLVFSAYFSATETAFTSLNRIRMKNKADDGDKRAKKVLDLEAKYDNLLSTILIGNNLVNIATTAIATVFFVKIYGQYGASIATVVTTVVVLIFGEITPKSLAKDHAEGFALHSAGLIGIFRYVLAPLNWLFSQWKKMLKILFRTKESRGISEDELITIVEEAEEEGSIGQDQSKLIQNAIDFNNLEAWDVLTPRVDIKAIEFGTDVEEVSKLFKESGYSRLPVYEDDIDNILGVLNQKDFFHHVIEGKNKIDRYIKSVIYVAGSMKIADLLKKLQQNKCRMAIVVDEYGGTTGIVTVDDIVEEIFGQFYDESDGFVDREITPLQNGSYRVLGSANVEKMLDYFDEEQEIKATTVNGWVVLQLDRLPKKGDKFDYKIGEKIFKVRVTKADSRKAIEINLRVEQTEEKEGEER